MLRTREELRSKSISSEVSEEGSVRSSGAGGSSRGAREIYPEEVQIKRNQGGVLHGGGVKAQAQHNSKGLGPDL